MQETNWSHDELRRIAEELILGQKSWNQINFPSENDRLHVKAIVDRGMQALGEEQRQVKVKRKRELGGTVTIQEYVMGHSLSDLMTEAGCTPFDFSQLEREPGTVKRRLFEALTHSLSDGEMASLIQNEGEVLAAVASDHEKEVYREENKEPVRFGLASATTLRFVEKQSGHSAELATYLANYRSGLKEELDHHCRELFAALSLDRMLSSYSDSQWRRLVGLTPREQMGRMAFTFPEETLATLLSHLPKRQQEEVRELLHWNELERSRRFEVFGDSISALKRWAALVNRVGREV